MVNLKERSRKLFGMLTLAVIVVFLNNYRLKLIFAPYKPCFSGVRYGSSNLLVDFGMILLKVSTEVYRRYTSGGRFGEKRTKDQVKCAKKYLAKINRKSS